MPANVLKYWEYAEIVGKYRLTLLKWINKQYINVEKLRQIFSNILKSYINVVENNANV